jgi:hypothetical protein
VQRRPGDGGPPGGRHTLLLLLLLALQKCVLECGSPRRNLII